MQMVTTRVFIQFPEIDFYKISTNKADSRRLVLIIQRNFDDLKIKTEIK